MSVICTDYNTRLSAEKVMNNVFEATIFNRKFKEKYILLPRILMIPTDIPFESKRLQFDSLLK